MTVLNLTAARSVLTDLRWPTRVDFSLAVKGFQRGWNLGPALTIDGLLGPATSAALEQSHARRTAGQPTASEHFSFSEFACGCLATFPGCAGISVLRGLLAGLERLRVAYYPHGMTVRSGYRCAQHNTRAGGAPDSQHLYGAAADVDYAASTANVAHLGVFSGIGYATKTELVRHVDVRHLSGHDSTAGTTAHPTTWPYAE